jgi:hypothetical protein
MAVHEHTLKKHAEPHAPFKSNTNEVSALVNDLKILNKLCHRVKVYLETVVLSEEETKRKVSEA